MKRMLFVDDEPLVLQGLRRMLRSMRNEWKLYFFTRAEEALKCMDKIHFDIVVSDIRIPGMGGVRFLNEVRTRYPQTVRIILSGHCDDDALLQSIGVAHQIVPKPCDANSLKEILAHTFALRGLLSNTGLQKLVSGIDTLPSVPRLYLDINDELMSSDPSIQRVADIISTDLGMTAKILQMINSAFFGLRCKVSNIKQAVTLLGLNTISSFVLTTHFFSMFKGDNLRNFPIDQIRTHSMRTGMFAAAISNAEGQEANAVDDARIAGFLHDCGKLLLADKLTKPYIDVFEQSHKDSLPLWQIEYRQFEASHAEVGAYLLGLWGLSDNIVEAIAFHHRPEDCPHEDFYPITAVYVANLIEHEITGPAPEDLTNGVSENYLDMLHLENKLPEWRKICYDLDTQKEV